MSKFEIERKFVVTEIQRSNHIKQIAQYYLKTDDDTAVRVRGVWDNMTGQVTYYQTTKKFIKPGVCEEDEIEVSRDAFIIGGETSPYEAIYKTRVVVPYEPDSDLCWEIDMFGGDNNGLIIAEIELPSIDYDLQLPYWIGKEVTDLKLVSNHNLTKYPFNVWREDERQLLY